MIYRRYLDFKKLRGIMLHAFSNATNSFGTS